MSTFLFYRPNSNPGRYSRRERFSLRHTVLSDKALNDGLNLSMKKPTDSEPACPSVGNELDLSIRNLHCTQSISTSAETLPQSSDEHDACRISTNDDLDSLHSLFSAPDTDSESNIGIAESDEVHPAALGLASIKNISPSESGYSAQISKDDTPHIMDFGSPNSFERNCVDQRSWAGRNSCIASEPSGPMPAFAPHSANVSPSPILQPIYDSIELTSSLARNEHLERAEDLVPKWDGDILGAETSSDETSPKTSYLEAQDDISLQHYVETHETSSADLVPDHPQHGIVAPASFLVEERNLSTEGGSRPAPQASSGSSDLFDPFLWQEEQPRDGSCHPDIDCIDPTDCIAIPELNKSIIENISSRSGLTNTAASWGDIDVEMQHSPHSPGEAPNDVKKTLSTVASEDSREPDTQVQPSQQPSFTRDVSSDLPADPTELPLSSVQGPRKYYEFSHIEIRNPRPSIPSKMVSPSVETERNTAASPVSSCHHLPATGGPWRLNGTILSIDLRHADFPTRFGKSTFRVYDGQVIQFLTLVHGPIKVSPPPKLIPGAKTSTKNRKLNRPAATAGPLSSEQKKRLLRLREKGYTWNEIAARFPGRKKGTLQATYYTTLKKLHPSTSLPQQRSRQSPSEPRRSHSPSQRLGHPRYSLRSRGVR
ncbi:hypothetical protein BDV23DRAFT_133057 [Aspergillus alliaceus]|uniref:Myb-like domain-containing protein n=1 Tax=Petromyces alliaceus TaxID=209559 RepID=A0A5N7BYI1_PETAA|nr:hypothetical protein BDV23DRAFT_133057 [Aspergillus alliaceus]